MNSTQRNRLAKGTILHTRKSLRTYTPHKHLAKPDTYEAELGSCVKVEVAVLVSLSLIVLTVSVEVKRH